MSIINVTNLTFAYDGSYDNSNDTGGDDTGEDPVEYYE